MRLYVFSGHGAYLSAFVAVIAESQEAALNRAVALLNNEGLVNVKDMVELVFEMSTDQPQGKLIWNGDY